MTSYLHFGFGNRAFDSFGDKPIAGITATDFNYDAIVLKVNPDNPLTNLTSSNLINIFNGVYINWNDIE